MNPAECLAGHTFGKWHVEELIVKPVGATGGFFSISYTARHIVTGQRAFVKAINLGKALQKANFVDEVANLLNSYKFELHLSNKCRDKDMNHVVKMLDHGYAEIDDSPIGRVPYIVFELAGLDVRRYLAATSSFDTVWALRTAKHAAQGLFELHRIGVAHQDVKPSNVLVCTEVSKLADLGKAAEYGNPQETDDAVFAGDLTYIPPELRYNQLDPDWFRRRIPSDLYQLGSLITFLITQVTMNELMTKHMASQVLPQLWGDPYQKVLPYLETAFALSLEDFEAAIMDRSIAADLTQIVKELCDPDPARRGRTRRSKNSSPVLLLEGYISRLEHLAQRVELGIGRQH